MSWIRVWIHIVFSTKNRTPFLSSNDLRLQVFDHIKKNAEEKEIWLDTIGGYHDHVHCLISLGTTQTLSKVTNLIKGESSFWINKNALIRDKFAWQDDYWAVSVSESHVPQVRKYIQSQELHHRNLHFNDEINLFMKKYGWKIIKAE
jgi:putative transposase